MASFTTSGRLFGGMALDKAELRDRFPAGQLWVYAAGIVDPGDGNIATLSLVYERDDCSTLDTLGSDTFTGSGLVKFRLGPFSVWETSGVPSTEEIAVIRFYAIKDAGADGTVECVTLWPRWLPPRQ